MNDEARSKLHSRVKNDAAYAALTTHIDRVAYILDGVMSYEQFRLNIQPQLDMARSNTEKSSSKAIALKKQAQVHISA